ncbi:MAG: hypothetical protein K8S13_10080 [Desulfobacula sp.]|uniref:DOMON domain-containing protein n=1 Tax=Desulfobacula sp. TaxID=2593537 RepID=UPI0025C33C0E|nr:DOMON domain-containing protein [Desulfobacula sp.]MCD4720189.1 hypothetical protein [Desulfobacula sp.]
MKKNYLIFSIMALIFLLIPLSLSAMEYQHTLEVKNMQFSWTIEENQIHVQLSAKTTGWVAIGFDPEKAMGGANIIIGAVKKGKFGIEETNMGRRYAKNKKNTLRNRLVKSFRPFAFLGSRALLRV